MSAAPRDPMMEEHALPVRCEALGGGGIVQYACCLAAGDETTGETTGAPDAPLRAAVTALHRAGALAGVSEHGGHIDVIVRQRDEKRVKKKLARTLPSLRWADGDTAPTSTSRMSNCVEEALRFALITEAGWLPVQFRGDKWLVRAQQHESAPPMLELPPAKQKKLQLFDVVSFKFRAARAGSEQGVLLCKAYATKMWQPKDVVSCLPQECRAHLAEHGSVDLKLFIQDDSHEREITDQLVVATLPRLSRGIITWVGTELPGGSEQDEDWYRQHWLHQYSITLPKTLGPWVLVKFGEYDGKLYPACTLLRNYGGNHNGFGATLLPSSRSGGSFSGIHARLLGDLAKVRLLGGKSSAIAKNSSDEGAATAASVHIPKFQNVKMMLSSGAFSGTAPVSTVTVTASKPASTLNRPVSTPEFAHQLQVPWHPTAAADDYSTGATLSNLQRLQCRNWIHRNLMMKKRP
jgi:hypothetical protein